MLILDLHLSFWIFFSHGGGNRMLFLDLCLVSWLTAVLIALVRMPGVFFGSSSRAVEGVEC